MAEELIADTHDGVGPERRRDSRGASAVEYALLITGIAAVLVLVIYAFGGTLSAKFDGTCDSVQAQRQEPEC